MSVAEISALVVSITALVVAIGNVLSQIDHLNWHKAGKKQSTAAPPPPPSSSSSL